MGRATLGGRIFAALASLLAVLVLAAALYVPVMMMYWFAPPLTAWRSVPPPKALFFSFFACVMNWRAFLAYGAVTALVALGVPLAALSVLMLAGLRVAALSLVFPIILVLLPTLFASFYAGYRDIFAGE